MSERERVAEICTTSGYSRLKEVTGTSAVERDLSYKTPAGGRPAGVRVVRKILDSGAPPVDTKAKPLSDKGVDIYATVLGIDTLSGIGDARPGGGQCVLGGTSRRG